MSTIYQDIGDYRCLEQNPGLNQELARERGSRGNSWGNSMSPFFSLKNNLRLVAYLAGEDLTNKKAFNESGIAGCKTIRMWSYSRP